MVFPVLDQIGDVIDENGGEGGIVPGAINEPVRELLEMLAIMRI